MIRCHPDLGRLVEAAQVHSATRFSIAGQTRELPEPDTDRLLQALASELYYRLYCQSPAGQPPPPADAAESRDFVSNLSQANAGTGTWEPGWTMVGEDADGSIAVRRDRVTFWVQRAGLRTPSGKAAPGGACSVRIPKEMRQLFPSFYVALGNRHTDEAGPAPLLRLYWHLTASSAIRYVRLVTQHLNAAGIAFRTKVVANPRQYVRTDAGVLYLRKADFAQAAASVGATYRAVRAELQPEVPLFTKYLAPGLGLAEDPADGMSFGQARCQVAARGLWEAHAQGRHEPAGRLAALVAAFCAAGLDPEHPYREPGSADAYEIDLEQA